MMKPLALGAALAACALAGAGCGSSDSDTSSKAATPAKTATTAGGSAVVEQAKANLGELTQDPPKIVIPAMEKAPRSDVSLTFVTCPLPVCAATEVGAKQAAQALGWKWKLVNQGLTPATIQSAFNGVAQNPGDAVAADAVLPNSAIAKPLGALAAKGVPFVSLAQNDAPGKLMVAATAAPNQMSRDGQAMANWVIVDSNGKPGDMLFVYDPALVDLAHAQTGFHESMKQLCPDCNVSDLKIAAADSGTKIPNEVANQLRTHSDIKYVIFGLGDYATGVPQALKRANLPSTPKLITRAVSTTNMEDIKNGDMAAGLTSETVESGWRTVDLLARALNKEKLYSTTPDGGRTFLTAENLPADVSTPFIVPGFQKVYETAWGK